MHVNVFVALDLALVQMKVETDPTSFAVCDFSSCHSGRLWTLICPNNPFPEDL